MDSFKAKMYCMSKGEHSQSAFFATMNRETVESLGIRIGDGILVSLKELAFPTVVRKHGGKRFVHGFTVPYNIGKNFQNERELTFRLVTKNIDPYKIAHYDTHNLSITNVLSKTHLADGRIRIFELGNDMNLFWLYSRGNKPYILPSVVELEKNGFKLIDVMGAFICEGFKARQKGKHIDRLSFSNAEIEQIRWFTEALETLFGIKKEEWSVQILHPKNDPATLNKLRLYWSSVGFSPDRISVVKNSTVSSHYGICIQSIYNSTLAEVFSSIIDHCKGLALKNDKNSTDALRGFSRGDMGVLPDTISFDSENKNDVHLFAQVCERLGIKTGPLKFETCKRGWWYLRIGGWNNFKRILEIDGIRHTKRKAKLLTIFLKNQRTLRYRYLEAINRDCNTARKLSESFNRSVITTRFYLSKFRREGCIKNVLTDKFNTLGYGLTNCGKRELEFYMRMKNELEALKM